MRAIGVVEFGGPEALQVVEVPEPHAGSGEIRIRVRAATVNPTDTVLRSGARTAALGDRRPPYIPGMDAAGVIDEVGEGVSTRLAVGDRAMAIVLSLGPHGGAYAEYVVVPAESAVRAPAGASDAEASTLPMNGLTARLALDLLALRPGQTLAVTGAAGAFGGYVIQLARSEGLRVVADASPADEKLVRELGADAVVARGDGVADRFREAVPGGVDGLADGAVIGAAILPAVRDGGAVAAVRAFEGESQRDIAVHQVRVTDYAREPAKLDRLRELADKGVISLRVAGTFPSEQAAQAHRILEAGGTRGRLVIEF
ncbi:MAG TPA: NADP-dependent oxidoreductase [Actinomadura sp.]|jgi:NADPH:quinone reductase-like Zn-dependent oxidoreductase|nr:NADP-dependent oxidoreductase [Actinomadura sp.]